jgi:uncharacterized DUF497 family protein
MFPFDQAATVFLDALALTVYDDVNSLLEERWFTLGLDAGGKLLAVAHTYEVANPGSSGYVSSPPARRADVSDVRAKMNRDKVVP